MCRTYQYPSQHLSTSSSTPSDDLSQLSYLLACPQHLLPPHKDTHPPPRHLILLLRHTPPTPHISLPAPASPGMTNFYSAKSARFSGRGLADVSSGILASGYCFYLSAEVGWCGQRGGSQASGSQERKEGFGYGLALLGIVQAKESACLTGHSIVLWL